MKLAKKPWNYPKATLAYLRYSDRRTAYVSKRRLKRALRKAHAATRAGQDRRIRGGHSTTYSRDGERRIACSN